MAPSRGLGPATTSKRKSKIPPLFLLLTLSFCVQCLLSSSQGRMKRWKEMRSREQERASELREWSSDGAVGSGIWRKRDSAEKDLDFGTSPLALEKLDDSTLSSFLLDTQKSSVITVSSSSSPLTSQAETDQDEDAGSGTLLNIDYQGWYGSLSPAAKPFALGLLVLWAFTLFATIGITASDFFCPNLATVADRLGMNESTAGVTFLAFGNGSPDVFSTFSALSSGSFSLAIGELLGASAFIVSVVIGSMALVQPFHVPRWPFIRDVGFFTIAVLILVACLADGKLTLWESGGLVGMYVGYVGVVVGGNWVAGRRRRRGQREMTMDEHGGGLGAWRDEEEDAEEADDEVMDLAGSRSIFTSDGEHDESTATTRPGLSTRSRATTMTSHDGRSPSLLPNRLALTRHQSHTRVWPQRSNIPDTPRPHFSLLGAIEFRDAVNALRKESAAAAAEEAGEALPSDDRLMPQLDDLLGEPAMEEYFGPISPFTSGHYHAHPHGHAGSGPRTPRSRNGSPAFGRMRSSSHVATQRHPPGMSPLSLVGNEGANGKPPRFERAVTVAGTNQDQSVRKAVSLHDVRRASAGVVQSLDKPSIGVHPATPPAGGLANDALSISQGSKPTSGDLSLRLSIPDGGSLQSRSQPDQPHSPVDQTPTEGETLVDNVSEPNADLAKGTPVRRRKRTRAMNILWAILHTLFPSLHGFWSKSFAGMFLAILASPAILGLTLTLPVVDDCAEGLTLNSGGVALEGDEGEPLNLSHAENGHAVTEQEAEQEDDRHLAGDAGHQLHLLSMTGGVPSPSQEHAGTKGLLGEAMVTQESDDDEHEHLLYNNYLVAAQCVFGTLFCSYAIFCELVLSAWVASHRLTSDYYIAGLDWGNWALLGFGVAGGVCGVYVLLYGEDGRDPLWRLVRCFAGFFAAMVWISTIADEMVQVLLTFGVILGLSEAIIGLTIFAIGASMADLISNLTVAKIAPAMSHAACYGGPLLNCLLGIGGAGTYAGLTTNRAYPVHFSHTLWVSAIGLIFILVSTLIYVPWNGYYISRSWAVFLIAVYVILTTINIVVEIKV